MRRRSSPRWPCRVFRATSRRRRTLVLFAEDVERRLDQLQDATLKRIAVRKLEGYGVQEIATELGASTRTVERKLRLIRAIWEEETAG